MNFKLFSRICRKLQEVNSTGFGLLNIVGKRTNKKPQISCEVSTFDYWKFSFVFIKIDTLLTCLWRSIIVFSIIILRNGREHFLEFECLVS